MNLGPPNPAYDLGDQTDFRRQVEQADELNRKADDHVTIAPGQRLYAYDANGVRRYLSLNASGVATWPTG